jgi:hypothetical protein
MLVWIIKLLGKIWLYGACFLILVGYASTWYLHGFGALQELVNPFNFWNYVAVVITLAPVFFLDKLAEEIRGKNRRKILRSSVAVFLSVSLVILVAAFVTIGRNSEITSARQNDKSKEYTATSVRVKSDSATMYRHKNTFLGVSSGPVGKSGIPERIRIGDAITVDGSTIRVNHIVVTEILTDMSYGGKVFATAGDIHCNIVESLENLPSVDENTSRDRLWINVQDCVPLHQ